MKARVTVYLNERSQKPGVNAPNPRYYAPGDIIEIVEIVNGDVYEGNKVWYRLDNGSFVWSGGVEGLTKVNLQHANEVFDISNCWWLKDFGVEELWSKGLTGKGIKITLLDSGVSLPHPDLNLDSQNICDFSDSASGTMDVNGHGTHCAGIIKGSNNGFGITGVAYNSELAIGKITNDAIGDDFSYLIKGVNWAVAQKSDIISISNGRPLFDQRLEQAIQKAVDKGILVVCAAGNKIAGYPDDHIYYPARFAGTFSVGGIAQTGEPLSDSLLTGETSIFAPGKDIYSTYKNCSYKSLSGSSQAAPFVTGVCALLLEYCRAYKRKISASELKQVLADTSLSMPFGKIIDPLKAFNYLQS